MTAEAGMPAPAPRFMGSAFDVVAIACSAGCTEPLRQILQSLPPSFPAAVVVLRHSTVTRRLASGVSALAIEIARHGEPLEPGTVFVAPSDRHLLVTAEGRFCLTESPPVNFVRPSAELLFESVAACYGERAIAVVLTGHGNDGAIGVRSIKRAGGILIAQAPSTAVASSMPSAAVRTGPADLVLPPESIAAALVTLASGRGTLRSFLAGRPA